MDAPIKKGRVRSSTTTAVRGDLNFSIHPRVSVDENEESGMKRYGALDDLLSSRPAKEELLRTNILKGDISDRIVAAQEELKKNLVEDSLKKKILNRPAPGDLGRILLEESEDF